MNTLRCKSKPKNPFNIAQNQEFELVTSSPKPAWNSQWSLISLRNLKR